MSADVDANERTWDAHTAAEFVTADVDTTMATMTDDPVVLHVPTSIGARGRDAVRRLRRALHRPPGRGHDPDGALADRHRGPGRRRDHHLFTHDVEVPWVLPGVAPTGARVTVPIVTVIGMRDGLVDSEHIYWDQASVLAQVGLLDPGGLPVTGADQIRPLAPQPPADSFNALLRD